METPSDKKAEIIKQRRRKQEEIMFAERLHKEQREKAEISQGGVSKLAKGEGQDSTFVGRLFEMKEQVQETKRAMAHRGRDFFGGGGSTGRKRKKKSDKS